MPTTGEPTGNSSCSCASITVRCAYVYSHRVYVTYVKERAYELSVCCMRERVCRREYTDVVITAYKYFVPATIANIPTKM